MMAIHVLPVVEGGRPTGSALVFAGRSAALFALLAGVSLALVTGGPQAVRGRSLTAYRVGVTTRAAILFAVGLTLGELDSGVAVILCWYALLFVLALPFLGLPPRTLAGLAAAVALLAPALSHLLRRGLPAPSYQVPAWESLREPGTLAVELALTGFYPALPWLAYALAGLAVGRLPLRQATRAAGLLALGVLLAVAGWAASRLLLGPLGGRAVLAEAGTGDSLVSARDLDVALETSMYGVTPTTSWWWLAVDAPHSSTTPDMMHTTGTGLAVLGVMLLLLRRPRWWLAPLVAAGSMVLSLYTLHVVLLATLLPDTTPYAYGWHLLVAAAAALAWRRYVGRGPLEEVTARASAAARAAVAPTRDVSGRPS